MRKITKRSTIIATGSVLAVATGTAAFAIANDWFSGESTTNATTSSIQDFNVTATLADNAANRLYPGKSVQVIATSVTNPNDYPVQLLGATVTTVTGPAGCNQSMAGFSFTEVPNTIINPGVNSQVDLGKVTMSTSANKVCAGGAITIKASLQGQIAG